MQRKPFAKYHIAYSSARDLRQVGEFSRFSALNPEAMLRIPLVRV